MALKRQIRAHELQSVHRFWSTRGMSRLTALSHSRGIEEEGRWALSTSQSTYATVRPCRAIVRARLTATVVLPVPPLPLATASLIRRGLTRLFSVPAAS